MDLLKRTSLYVRPLWMWRFFFSWTRMCYFNSLSWITIHIQQSTPKRSTGSVLFCHYDDVTMSGMVSLITSLTIVYSTVYSGADQRKHQSPASLAFPSSNGNSFRVAGPLCGEFTGPRSPVNSPHKGPVTRKLFPFDDVIMSWLGFICRNFSRISNSPRSWDVIHPRELWRKFNLIYREIIYEIKYWLKHKYVIDINDFSHRYLLKRYSYNFRDGDY